MTEDIPMEESGSVDDERKPYESNAVWRARKTFMEAHWDDMPRNNLRCFSSLFINVNMLGCEYNPTLMERMRTLGAGIMDRARKLENVVKASEERVHANEVREKAEARRSNPSVAKTSITAKSALEEKLKLVKGHLLIADRNSSPLQLLNFACTKTQITWQFVDKFDGVELRLDDHLAFKRKFTSSNINAKELAITSVVESFLEAGESTVVGKEVHFGGKSPHECYVCSLMRSFSRSARHIEGKTVDVSKLKTALLANNVELEQSLDRLKGWEQQLVFRAGDVLLSHRVLKKGDCVKPKVDQIINEVAQQIATAIRNPVILADDKGDLVLQL